jgi:hypothetical protein
MMASSGLEGMVVGSWEDHEGPKSDWTVEESMVEVVDRGVDGRDGFGVECSSGDWSVYQK